jgi:hypothetical protein
VEDFVLSEVFITKDQANDTITGAIISHADVCDGWTRLFLMDGRVLLFAECEAFAIVSAREILQ